MATVLEKLNWKDQQEVVVLNAPESFEPELARLSVSKIHRSLLAAKETTFLLTFVTRQSEVDSLAPQIAKRAKGDAIVWFAYPKGSSKKYKCDFNRDTGWKALNELGFETVRAIAIDEDWTALRFRRSEFVKARRNTSSAS
jgi:hypothetical protein